jgi:hypothetical protein
MTVVDGHRIRRDGAARVDEVRAARVADPPDAGLILLDVLPLDLADMVGAAAGGLVVDHADAGARGGQGGRRSWEAGYAPEIGSGVLFTSSGRSGIEAPPDAEFPPVTNLGTPVAHGPRQRSWLSLLPRRLMPATTMRPSRPDWQLTQVVTPGMT